MEKTLFEFISACGEDWDGHAKQPSGSTFAKYEYNTSRDGRGGVLPR